MALASKGSKKYGRRAAGKPENETAVEERATPPGSVVTLVNLPKFPINSNPVTPFAPACATFRSYMRRRGLKFTPERAAVLDVVLRQPALFDAETVADELKHQGHRGSRATVYRTLGHLQDAGLIRQVVFDNSQGFYEVVTGRQAHDYLIDVDSGEVIPIRSERLEQARDELCRELGVEPVRHQFHIFVRRSDDGGQDQSRDPQDHKSPQVTTKDRK